MRSGQLLHPQLSAPVTAPEDFARRHCFGGLKQQRALIKDEIGNRDSNEIHSKKKS